MHELYYQTDFLATLIFVLFVCVMFCVFVRADSKEREKKEKSNVVKHHAHNHRNY